MSGNITGKTYSKTCFHNFRGRPYLWVIFLLLFFSSGLLEVVGQNPVYQHVKAVDMGSAGISNPEDLKISLDTDSNGFVYVLTFGKILKKYNKEGDFIGNISLKATIEGPVDMAINSKDEIFVADYEGRKIFAFDLLGNNLSAKNKSSGYFKPLGIAFDKEDNLYVADYNDGSGAENTEGSRLKIHFENGGQSPDLLTNKLIQPYRLDIDSKGNIYVSHSGADQKGEVKVFDKNFQELPIMAGIKSPGSIVVDKEDFIHVIYYAEKVDFQAFIKQDPIAVFNMLPGIRAGIRDNIFKIRIYGPDGVFIKNVEENNPREIDFPLDLAFGYCASKMYLNDAYIGPFGFELDFNLEIFKRTPFFDTVPPAIVCPDNIEIQAPAGQNYVVVNFPDATATDNCTVTVKQTAGQASGSQFPVGTHTIGFTATDASENFTTCSFTIIVTPPPNSAPVAKNDTYITDQEVTLNVSEGDGVLKNDTEAENDPLTATLVTTTTNGVLTLASNGSFTYVPNPGYFGQDSFTYFASDGELDSNTATVSITVTEVSPPPNSAPVANNDTYTTDQDVTLNVSEVDGVLKNDTDAENDPLTATLVTSTTNGVLTLDSNGSFRYVPSPGYFGQDSFTYFANDGELDSNTATVSITVTEVSPPPNSAPVANNDTYTTDQDVTLNVSEVDGVLKNDTDAENDPLTATLVTSTTNGFLTLASNGTFIYVPNPGYFGQDSFTYFASDGELDSNIATVTIQVDASGGQNLPVTEDDDFTIFIDETLDVPAPGILENDAFESVTSIRLLIDVQNGTLTLNNDGSFLYIPNPGFTGEDSFRYLILDGGMESNSSTVTITVETRPAQNEAPVANDDFYEIQQDGVLVVDAPGILANDTDANADVLTASVGSVTGSGSFEFNGNGSFKYTPLPGFTGTESFTYTANDGSLNSNVATVTITVNGSTANDFACKNEVTLQLDVTGNISLQASDLYTGDPGDREFTLSKSSFDCSNIGENSVELNYTGSEGSGSCTIKVIIEDNLAPEIQAQNIIVSLDSFGFASITPEIIDTGTSDNCGVAELSLDILDFSCENLGLNKVLLTAKDASGNTSTQTVNVNITGNCKQTPIPEIEYIFIYPNPTPGPFAFEVPTGWIIEKVDVFDFRGRYILTAEFPMGGPYNMDLSTLQTAVYTLHLSTNQGNKVIRVIIK